jgi:hypothetical protein
VRDPIKHLTSGHRYSLEMCGLGKPYYCNAPKSFEDFAFKFCKAHKNFDFCLTFLQYMQGAADSEDYKGIVAQFDVVVVLERWEESLALMIVICQLPGTFSDSFQDKANVNTAVQKEEVSADFTKRLGDGLLKADLRIYEEAVLALEHKVAGLNSEDKLRYHAVLSRQSAVHTTCQLPCPDTHCYIKCVSANFPDV